MCVIYRFHMPREDRLLFVSLNYNTGRVRGDSHNIHSCTKRRAVQTFQSENTLMRTPDCVWIISSQRDRPMSKSLLLSLEISGAFWLSLLWPCHLSLLWPNILPWQTRDGNIDTTQNIFREEEVRIHRGCGGVMHSIGEMIQPVFKNTVCRQGNKKIAD